MLFLIVLHLYLTLFVVVVFIFTLIFRLFAVCVEMLYAADILTGHQVCSIVCSICMKAKLFRKDKIKFVVVGVIN